MADNSPTFQHWEPTVNGVQVPKGRLTVHAVSRPFGTYCACTPDPNVETLGYCRKSLRDKDLSAFCGHADRAIPSRHWTGLSALRSANVVTGSALAPVAADPPQQTFAIRADHLPAHAARAVRK